MRQIDEDEQQQLASTREAQLRQEFVSTCVKEDKLRFVHVRPINYTTLEKLHKGGCTVVYALPPRKGDSLITMAIALVHPNDTFCKRTGRYVACSHWVKHNTIALRVPKNTSPATFLKATFFSMFK